MVSLQRQRKTKEPCLICLLHKDLCICHLLPSLELKTRVCLVVHAKELKRTTNTGRLAIRCLVNSEMKVRGADREVLDLSPLLSDQYRSVLFYPCEGAKELDQEFLSEDPRPVQLFVPDGNWRQASKVHYRHHELRDLPRVMISSPNESPYHMRAENTKEGMATLQAIAEALGVIEGPEIREALMRVYQAKLERTLLGRGVLKAKDLNLIK